MLWVDPPIPIESYLCCLFLLFVFFSLFIFAFNELLKSSQTSKLYVWKNRRKTKPDSLIFVFVFVVDRKWFFSPHSRKRLQEKIVYIFFRRKICIVHRFETSALVNNSTRQHHTNKFFRRRFFFFPPFFLLSFASIPIFKLLALPVCLTLRIQFEKVPLPFRHF